MVSKHENGIGAGWYAPRGQRSGIHVFARSADFVGVNTLRVTIGTTGLCGGDPGHGCRTVFALEDLGGTAIRVAKIKDCWSNGGVEIILAGDSEALTFLAALEYAAARLRERLDLFDDDWITEERDDTDKWVEKGARDDTDKWVD